MILKIFNLKRGNRDQEEASDTSFVKKEHKQVTKDQKVWTHGHWLLVNDLLSHAQYRDPYFDFTYYADQLFVSVLLVVVLDIQWVVFALLTNCL